MDWQKIQWKGRVGDSEVASGGVSRVVSSHCFPLSIILISSIGDREGKGVAYEETGPFSSNDKEAGCSNNGKEGGGRSSVSNL